MHAAAYLPVNTSPKHQAMTPDLMLNAAELLLQALIVRACCHLAVNEMSQDAPSGLKEMLDVDLMMNLVACQSAAGCSHHFFVLQQAAVWTYPRTCHSNLTALPGVPCWCCQLVEQVWTQSLMGSHSPAKPANANARIEADLAAPY